MLATIGTTMMLSTTQAGSIPWLDGYPENSGMKPRWWVSHGSTCSARNGPITRMPQRPSTTLGMAASSSTISPTGVRSIRGASSLRNRPIAIAIGTAITSATTDVSSVPMMKLRAPNWPVTTFHWSLVMKPSPNSWMLGQACLAVS